MSRLIIEAGRPESHYWADLWRYRELFYFLAWKEVLVRYKQTVIGLAWAVLRPLLMMVVLTVVFGRIAKLATPDIPYPILVYAAVLPWQFFATAVTEASNSLISNSNLISKVYFPRLIIPASAVITSLVDLVIASLILFGLMAWYGFVPDWRIFTLPLFIGLAFTTAMGFGFWMAALNVRYRDFRYIVPFVVQMGLYVSPVGFSSSLVPEQWRWAYSLNPMVGVIDGFRWAVLRGHEPLYVPSIVLSICITGGILFLGLRYFRRTEKQFADVI